MILVHVIRTWPDVLAGALSPETATLGEWGQLSEENIADHGDVIFGIYNNEIVTAYQIDGHYRDRKTRRVTFAGRKTDEWSSYIGQPNPGTPWGVRGYARSVQALPTDDLTNPPLEPESKEPKPTLEYREAKGKQKAGWVTKYPGGLSVTLWDDGTLKVGKWDHKIILVDPKPRNYGVGKSRGGGLIRMRFEPLESDAPS